MNPYRIAEQYAAAGDGNEAIAWLTRANAERAHRFVHRTPRWDLVRADARFPRLLHLMAASFHERVMPGISPPRARSVEAEAAAGPTR